MPAIPSRRAVLRHDAEQGRRKPRQAFDRARHALAHSRHALAHSLRLRLMVLFLLLALAMAGTFLFGMQTALGTGWRAAGRPLVVDYVDRLVAELGTPPSIERAQALADRLPVAVRISGPGVNWDSRTLDARRDAARFRGRWGGRPDGMEGEAVEPRLLERMTADGHVVALSLNVMAWRDQPRRVGWITLAVLLSLTALAYAYVRRILRPLDDIRAGALRFGGGDFIQPIPIRRRDELGDLATGINTMATDIHRMLDAKRALLLAISHELRSPLTRARVNTELLPETPELQAMRDALLRDLGSMRDLITDLLESERLGQGHAALHLEPTDAAALAHEVIDGVEADISVRIEHDIASDLALLPLDRARIRLLLRNLLHNALRHGAAASRPPVVHLQREGESLVVTVRDHGPGVDASALSHLAEPFFRPDAARERATGGVGLGLYLCKLVALAHCGSLELRNASPGLEVRVLLPISQP